MMAAGKSSGYHLDLIFDASIQLSAVMVKMCMSLVKVQFPLKLKIMGLFLVQW
jgi:hypothetical protein